MPKTVKGRQLYKIVSANRWAHRCDGCRVLRIVRDLPAPNDNGFTLTTEPARHLSGCPYTGQF